MSVKFVRIVSMHGTVQYFNAAYIISVKPRKKGHLNEVGATVEILHGQEIKNMHTEPGEHTNALIDALGLGR